MERMQCLKKENVIKKLKCTVYYMKILILKKGNIYSKL